MRSPLPTASARTCRRSRPLRPNNRDPFLRICSIGTCGALDLPSHRRHHPRNSRDRWPNHLASARPPRASSALRLRPFQPTHRRTIEENGTSAVRCHHSRDGSGRCGSRGAGIGRTFLLASAQSAIWPMNPSLLILRVSLCRRTVQCAKPRHARNDTSNKRLFGITALQRRTAEHKQLGASCRFHSEISEVRAPCAPPSIAAPASCCRRSHTPESARAKY